jgi:hypothetical protein
MLKGEIMIFSDSELFSSTFLKMSKANPFSDLISEVCAAVRSMGTGSGGKLLSAVLEQDIMIMERTAENNAVIRTPVDFIFLSVKVVK